MDQEFKALEDKGRGLFIIRSHSAGHVARPSQKDYSLNGTVSKSNSYGLSPK